MRAEKNDSVILLAGNFHCCLRVDLSMISFNPLEYLETLHRRNVQKPLKFNLSILLNTQLSFPVFFLLDIRPETNMLQCKL